jgi:hypothetical protein
VNARSRAARLILNCHPNLPARREKALSIKSSRRRAKIPPCNVKLSRFGTITAGFAQQKGGRIAPAA